MKLHRILIPVRDIDAASRFYGEVFAAPGERVAVNRHYFDGGGVVVGIIDPQKAELQPNPEHIYFSMEESLETVRDTWLGVGGTLQADIRTYDWGETSFYGVDPWGNQVCFIAAGTEFSGGRFVP